MSVKIKNGDCVVVLTGKDKRKIGNVIKVVVCGSKKKVVVSGVNMCSRHTKAKSGSSNGGGILNKELAIDVSNVAILDPKCKIPTKVGFKVVDGRKVRFSKISGEVID